MSGFSPDYPGNAFNPGDEFCSPPFSSSCQKRRHRRKLRAERGGYEYRPGVRPSRRHWFGVPEELTIAQASHQSEHPVEAQEVPNIASTRLRTEDSRDAPEELNTRDDCPTSADRGPEPAAPVQDPTGPSPLRQLAADAAIMLKCFSKTAAVDDQFVGETHRLLVRDAAAAVAKIQSRLRVVSAARNEDMETAGPPSWPGKWVNARCVVCYEEEVNIVLVPCGHLALCGRCCQKMGVGELDWNGKPRLCNCPVCRKQVKDTMKVFRAE